MKLLELSADTSKLTNFEKDEIDFMAHWAKKNGFEFELDTPAMASFSKFSDDDSMLHVDIHREPSRKHDDMFHYRVGSTVTDEDDSFPGPVEFLSPAFVEEKRIKFLDRTLQKVEE
jgi:hypothetical protein